MQQARGQSWAAVAGLTGVQLALGVSLGLFYNYTYFGRAAVPLPHPVAAFGALFYYVAENPEMGAAAQAVLWVLAFVVVGWLWVAALWAAAWGLRRERPVLGPLLVGSLIGLAPLLAPAPWLAWLHALTPAGVSWRQFVQVSLYRGYQVVPQHLNELFLSLACAGLLLETWWLRRTLVGPWWRPVAVMLAAAVLTAVVAAPFGVLLGLAL